MIVHSQRLLAWSARGVFALAFAALTARAQVAVPPVPDVPKVPRVEGAVDTPREAVREARDAARAAGRDAREAGRDVREGVREARRDVRDAAQEIDRLRAADIGLWFSGRGGAEGLLVADVASGGAIAKIGFQEGDRIVSVNDQKVASEAEFMAFLRDEQLRDQKVKVVVFRGGRETVLYIMPAVIYREAVVYDPLWRYGIVLDDRYPDRVVVLRVYPRTPAYYAGLRAGDVVVGLRGQRIARMADFVNAFTSADGRLALQVNRANRTRDLEIDASTDAETRSTLRPNIDPETRIDGRGRVERLENRPDLPGDSPRIERPRPNEPATPSRLGSPEKPAAPEKPATPAAPKVEVPSAPEKPAAPVTPKVEVPALPAPPATPAVPALPKP